MSADWQEVPEAGSATGIRFLVWVARVTGRRVLHVLLAPIAAYFLVARRDERRASAAYLQRALGRTPRLAEQFRHFYTFARVIADRYYFISGETGDIPITVYGADQLQALVDLGKGGIALSAHLGSFEAARVLGTRLSDVVLRMVLDRKVNANLVNGLESINPEFADVIIDLNQSSASLALTIAEALKRGEWIGFLADRNAGNDKTAEFDFLGSPARFPLGPCIIAGMFNAPLIAVFPLFVNGGYEIHCEILSAAPDLPRDQREARLRDYTGRFVARLEFYARKAPYNWFNFYDFWV